MVSLVEEMIAIASTVTGYSLHIDSHIYYFDTKQEALTFWREEVDKTHVLSAKLYTISASGLKKLDYVII
jgi:hypothetical protein